MSEPETKDAPPRPWQTANPWISGLLAYLVPGAGHLYQGRHFKAVLYSVCILGSFFYGTSLADWKAVNFGERVPGGVARRGAAWGVFAQVGVGLPALTAVVQSERYSSQFDVRKPGPRDVARDELEQPLDEPFEGRALVGGDVVEVEGRLQLEPAVDRLGGKIVRGRLTGTDAQGAAIDVAVEGRVEIGLEIFGSEDRYVRVGRGGVPDLVGDVPRPFLDWYQVPLEREQEQALHQGLGKTYEIALVYTWIAGLLNILAVWDCVAGPAYGIGDEPEDEEDEAKRAESPRPIDPVAATMSASAAESADRR